VTTRSLALGLFFLATGLSAGERALTCDPAAIDPRSYRLTTRAVAMASTGKRLDFWDAFDITAPADRLAAIAGGATFAAQRAAEIDPGNAMAPSILARQFLILEEPEPAEKAWRRVMDGGGAVVWTATLYDVDVRSYFFVAFRRDDLRVYRFSQMTQKLKQGAGGIPQFPGPEDESFWAAGGGCFPETAKPEAIVPWSHVREIKGGNWVLYFKLTQPIRVTSDRGKDKRLDEIKVALHGRAGDYEEIGDDNGNVRSRGPWSYYELIRRTLVKFVDPDHRIALPPSKPGLGW
jgi:hypothetical protein